MVITIPKTVYLVEQRLLVLIKDWGFKTMHTILNSYLLTMIMVLIARLVKLLTVSEQNEHS